MSFSHDTKYAKSREAQLGLSGPCGLRGWLKESRAKDLVGLFLLSIVSLSAGGPEAAGTRLIDAIKIGDREAVRTLAKNPAEVNATDPDGTTSLQWAVRVDDLETTRLLLAAGANPKASNRYGVTALSLAAVNRNAAIVETLLKAGADATGSVSNGQTILMTAARTGDPTVVRLLLDHGADVNARESQLGETALIWAAAENHPEVVKLLVDRGADVNVRSKSLTFPRDRFGLEGVLTILPRGNWTPLMYAAREGATEAARALVDLRAQINAVDPDGTTALVRAITNAHYDTAGVLIEKGADPNIADTAGMAALYAAVDMSSLGEVYGRPARKVNDKLTPFDVIDMLLARGANPNAQLKTPTLQRNHTPGEPLLGEGTTPLMRAAKNGDFRAMQILLDHGADPTIVQKNHTTVLMLAAGLGRGLGVFAKDVGSEADLHAASKLALDHGVDVNLSSDSGLTALHLAAQSGLDSIVKLLVERGARLDVKDKQGRTPVDVALGVGGRGRAGGPPPVYEKTAALLRELGSAQSR
jgi:ankyrin repeat protein